MAIRFDDDIDTVKEKITQSLTNVYTRDSNSIPKEKSNMGVMMYVDSRFKEH